MEKITGGQGEGNVVSLKSELPPQLEGLFGNDVFINVIVRGNLTHAQQAVAQGRVQEVLSGFTRPVVGIGHEIDQLRLRDVVGQLRLTMTPELSKLEGQTRELAAIVWNGHPEALVPFLMSAGLLYDVIERQISPMARLGYISKELQKSQEIIKKYGNDPSIDQWRIDWVKDRVECLHRAEARL